MAHFDQVVLRLTPFCEGPQAQRIRDELNLLFDLGYRIAVYNGHDVVKLHSRQDVELTLTKMHPPYVVYMPGVKGNAGLIDIKKSKEVLEEHIKAQMVYAADGVNAVGKLFD